RRMHTARARGVQGRLWTRSPRARGCGARGRSVGAARPTAPVQREGPRAARSGRTGTGRSRLEGRHVNHLTPDEIEALVMRGDPLPDTSRRHVATCPACAGRVEREARLELAIYDAAAALGDEREASSGAGRAPIAAGATGGA